ncbi:Probable chitinase 10 [Gryllus bimaculatus]|nr:Probable chitinase 10 [Gryllus bimaculatus]
MCVVKQASSLCVVLRGPVCFGVVFAVCCLGRRTSLPLHLFTGPAGPGCACLGLGCGWLCGIVGARRGGVVVFFGSVLLLWLTKPPTTTTAAPSPQPPHPGQPHPGQPPVEVGGRCDAGSYRADPDNCQAYYRCILGEWRREYCAGGLHWNAHSGICDWPSEAHCGREQSTQAAEPPTTQRPRPPTTESSSRPPWWWSTTKTTAADWWQPSTTPVSTTDWWQPTTAASTSESEGTENPMNECVSGQYYPDHGNCHNFFVCVNGMMVRQGCAPGLVWNQEKSMCDWEFNVPCQDRTHAAIQYASVNEPCTDGPLASYPGDCTKYLYCQWGQYQEGTCAPGLNWNSEGKICDWPANAHCEDSGSGTPPPGPGTSPPGITTTRPTMRPTTRPTTTAAPGTSTPAPPPDGPELSGYFKVVCYFTNWAWYRPGQGKYLPEDINPDLCTHIIYGFAVLDYENLIIKAHDSWADFDNSEYYLTNLRASCALKRKERSSLALTVNDSAGAVNSPSARRRFIQHVLDFLEKYEFDGLDLDWEYPVCWQVDCKKGPPTDKAAFGDFVRELRAAFAPRGLLLSAAVSPSKTVVDAGYDVPALGESLDWVAVMTYDYHGQWDKKTGHVAPMYFHPDDDFHFFNANYSINYWIQEGVPRRKIVMGMPMYGQSFQLAQSSVNGLNAAAPGPGQAGPYTRAAGFLAYYEICDRVLNQGWTVVQDAERRMGPYAFKGNQWVGFDDIDMIELKSRYIRENDLGGGMIWALDLDDFRGVCGQGRHPLLNTIRRVLADPPGPTDTTSVRPTPLPTKPTPPGSGGSGSGGGGGGGDITYPPTVSTTTQRPGKPGTSTTPRPGAPGEYKMVCYFTNWAWYRQGPGKYLPSDIDHELCTHIVYGFAVLNGDQLTIKPHDSWADIDNKFYEKVTAYKKYGIKVLVAIGGWNDSAGDKYSRLVNNPSARSRFITTVIDFIEKYDFDGLDLDWEYPVCWQVDCKKGPSSDKEGFAALVRELKAAFRPKGLLLSSAVSPSKAVIDAGYDVPTLSENLDWIAVMTYDYHGQWDKKTGHVAPMYQHPEDWDTTFNSNFTINYWIERGADPKKLVMGMPMYGQSFSLSENLEHGLNAPTYGGGEAGDQTRARGFLAYYEICERIQKRGWKVVRDTKGRIGPYAYSRDQWVSFDDTAQIRYKAGYVKRMGLGGAMIWALDLDDFRNLCGCEPHPLLRTINRVLRGYPRATKDCSIRATDEGKLQDAKPDDNRWHVTTMTVTMSTPKPVSEAMPGPASGSCSGSQIFIPHPTDCSKYYLCQYGQLLEQSCPPGLKWNQDHCDWPENTDCSNKPTLPPPPPPTQPPTVYPPTTMTTTTEIMPQPPPLPPGSGDSGYKVVCYFTNWAWYRQGAGKYLPADIDTSLCTHIAYGFAVLDGSTLTIKPHDSWADIDNEVLLWFPEFYQKVTAFKKRGIKVVIAIGGWNDSAGDKYSRLVNNPSARAKFIENVLQFITRYDFDGLDLDWEYPVCWQVDCSKGPPTDKEGFSALVRELSAAFRPKGLLLSSAVSPSKAVIDAGYDVRTMSQYMDWIAVMTYDFHGHWDKQTGHVAPLYYFPGDKYDYFNSNYSIHYWIERGADRRKLVMGMPMYGQSFSLADSSDHGLNAKTYGPGEAGEFTRAGGFMAYYEICYNVKNKGWTPVRDPQGRMGPYAYHGNQWVSYDDVEDIRRKSRFVKSLGLGGGMIWALDLDDFRNRCGCGTYPLLRTINSELRGISASTRDCT